MLYLRLSLEDVKRRTSPVAQNLANPLKITPRMLWMHCKQMQKCLGVLFCIHFQKTFHFNSKLWSNKNKFNLPGGKTGFDSQETKLPTYWNTPFSKIWLGMKMGQQTKFTVINVHAKSLYSLIADGKYRITSLGRNTWKTLIGSQASLQRNCNKEGFNVVCSSGHSRARIGFVGNNENACDSCDSRIGFGTAVYPDGNDTCGNVAKHATDNGDKYIKTMGYILVQ